MLFSKKRGKNNPYFTNSTQIVQLFPTPTNFLTPTVKHISILSHFGLGQPVYAAEHILTLKVVWKSLTSFRKTTRSFLGLT